MTIEEARATYRRLLDEIGCYDAIRNRPEFYDIVSVAIIHLMKPPQTPWVRTSDRLPTEADADNTMCWVFATTKSSNLPMPEAIAYIRANPDNYPYWMPIPTPPEVTA